MVKKPYKELHLADSIEELTKKVHNSQVSQVKKSSALLNAAKTLYKKSQTEPFDQEMTYILASRFLLVYENLLNIHTDKNFVQMMLGKEAQISSNQMNELKSDLIKRYEEASKQKSCQLVIQETPQIIKDENKLVFNNELFITCNDLFRALMNKKINLLILDARSPVDFEESHIKINNIINIPEDHIQSGLSAHKLGTTLPKETKEVWEKRETYDVIVLIDWDTSKSNYVASKVDKLRTAIVEWDLGRTYKENPVVLNFGFIDWLEMYPMLCTSPSVLYTKANSELDDLLNLEDIEYPMENESSADVLPDLIFVKPEDVPCIGNEVTISSSEESFESFGETELSTSDLKVVPPVDPGPLVDPAVADSKPIPKIPTPDGKSSFGRTGSPHENGTTAAHPADLNLAREALDRDRQILLDEARQAKKPKIKLSFIPARPSVNRAVKPRTVKPSRPFSGKRGIVNYGLTGLVNIKNTCYMNTILQCLRHVPQLFTYLCTGHYKRCVGRSPPIIIDAMAELFLALTDNEYISIRPDDFYNKIKLFKENYGAGNHEDGSEFLLSLIEALNEDTSVDIPSSTIWSESQYVWYKTQCGKASFMRDLLYHILKVEAKCDGCSATSIKYQLENVIYIPVPEEPFQLRDRLRKALLNDANSFCSKCNMEKTTTTTFTHCPDVFILSLQRQKMLASGRLMKNNAPCYFSTDLLRVGPFTYKLVSICLHSGTLESGHYTAACLNPHNNSWYKFNDEYVCPLNIQDESIRSQAYLFFYSRCDGLPNPPVLGDDKAYN